MVVMLFFFVYSLHGVGVYCLLQINNRRLEEGKRENKKKFMQMLPSHHLRDYIS